MYLSQSPNSSPTPSCFLKDSITPLLLVVSMFHTFIQMARIALLGLLMSCLRAASGLLIFSLVLMGDSHAPSEFWTSRNPAGALGLCQWYLASPKLVCDPGISFKCF